MSSKNQSQRINFASIKNQLEYPDFLEVQLKSFQDFFQMDTSPEKRKSEGYPDFQLPVSGNCGNLRND